MKKIFLYFLVIVYLPAIILIPLYFHLFHSKKIVRLLPINFSRIGGIYQFFWYQKYKNVKKIDYNYLDIFFIGEDFKHNKFWVKIWKRSFNIQKFTSFWKIYLFV